MSHIDNHTSAEEFFSKSIVGQSSALCKALTMGYPYHGKKPKVPPYFGINESIAHANAEILDDLTPCLPVPGVKQTVLKNISKRLHEVLGGTGDSDIAVQSFFLEDTYQGDNCYMQVVDLNPLNQRSKLFRVQYRLESNSDDNISVTVSVEPEYEQSLSQSEQSRYNTIYPEITIVENKNTFFAIDCNWAVKNYNDETVNPALTEVALVRIEPYQLENHDAFYRRVALTDEDVFPPVLCETQFDGRVARFIAHEIAAWIGENTGTCGRSILVSDQLVQNYVRLNAFLEAHLKPESNPLYCNGLDINILYSGFMGRADMNMRFESKTPESKTPLKGEKHDPINNVIRTAQKFKDLRKVMDERRQKIKDFTQELLA